MSDKSSRGTTSSMKSTSKSSRSSSSGRETKKSIRSRLSSIGSSKSEKDPMDRMEVLLARKDFEWDEKELEKYMNKLKTLVNKHPFDKKTSERAEAKIRKVTEVLRCMKDCHINHYKSHVFCHVKHYKMRLVLMAENFLHGSLYSVILKQGIDREEDPSNAPLEYFNLVTNHFRRTNVVASSWENLTEDEKVNVIKYLMMKGCKTAHEAGIGIAMKGAKCPKFCMVWHRVRADLREEENNKLKYENTNLANENKMLKTELAKLKQSAVTTDKSTRFANRRSRSKSASEKNNGGNGGKSKRTRRMSV